MSRRRLVHVYDVSLKKVLTKLQQLVMSSNQSAKLQRLARILIFAYGNLSYVTFSKANNNGADQNARMRSQICAFVIRMQQS